MGVATIPPDCMTRTIAGVPAIGIATYPHEGTFNAVVQYINHRYVYTINTHKTYILDVHCTY